MSVGQFILQLTGISLLNLGLLFIFSWIPGLADHLSLGWISLGFFFFFTIVLYLLGQLFIKMSNPNAFTGLNLLFILVKLFASIVLVGVYVKTSNPTDYKFIFPFFLTYLLFTSYETYMLIQIGKTK